MTKRAAQTKLGHSAESVLETLAWFNRSGIRAMTDLIIKGDRDIDQFQAFIEGRHAFEVAGWILKRTKEMQTRLRDFFGKEYDLTLFQEKLKHCGREQVEQWEQMGLKVGFLPQEWMAPDAPFPGWKVKPGQRFYDQLRAGNLKRLNAQQELVVDGAADQLEGTVVLFDTRCKPSYQDGKQMWQDDYLGLTIARLRKEGLLARYQYGPQESRYGISMEPKGEWERCLKPAVAQLFGLEAVRLERAIETSALSQCFPDLPRANDNSTSTWLWFEEFLEDGSQRLGGGCSDGGGLAYVFWRDSALHWDSIAPRPLAEL